MSEYKNLIITIVASVFILMAWQYFYEAPRLKIVQEQKQQAKLLESNVNNVINFVDRNTAINDSERIKISSKKLSGSINLRGLRFDDLFLNEYQTALNKQDHVILLSPSKSNNSYFAEIGWISSVKDMPVPDANSLWKADNENLVTGQSVNFIWQNDRNISFIVNVALDENYMLSISQQVVNDSNEIINLAPYGLINKLMPENSKSHNILHEGPIGVFKGKLVERTYESIKAGQKESYDVNSTGDWLGITDKYWITAFMPAKGINFNSNFIHSIKSNNHFYQADWLGHMNEVKPGEELKFDHLLFAGAKELKVIDNYAKKYDIKLFDRSVDFGWFYFLTKPMFNALQFFYKLFGNFGIAILMLTVIIKLIMFPLANKSYKSMNKMKKLQPELLKLKEIYGDDKLRINKEMIELYKKHKVNPLSGCLPILIQIPVFFSLYKVLFVTIEMRHAPFFGWIKDLSAADPTSIFNLFGLLNFTPPGFLMIGVWPILMGITMYLQQKMNPEPSDPVQAQVMKFLPFIFVFMFNSFPAGLIIYWAWNNSLSIIQQWIINRSENKEVPYNARYK